MGASSLSSRAIIGEFYNRLNTGPVGWVDKIGMKFDSNQSSETYKWLGMSPAMREWIGGRNAKALKDNGITIENKLFEATLEVSVDDIRRDKTDQVMTRINELAIRTNAHWASLLSTLIINGESTACYDGEYFFDTDHREGLSGTQSNDITNDITTTTAPTAAEMSDSILKGIQAIYGFKDDQGEPVNEGASNFMVMVPVPYMNATLAALRNTAFAQGVTNLIPNVPEFKIDPVINPRLTWTDKFAIFNTDGQTKPFILQEEEGVKIAAVAEGSELEFNERIHRYGVSKLGNVGYGQWQKGCLITHI